MKLFKLIKTITIFSFIVLCLFGCAELLEDVSQSTTTTISETLIEYVETFDQTSLSVNSEWSTDYDLGKISIDDYTITAVKDDIKLTMDFSDSYYNFVSSENGTQLFSVDNKQDSTTFTSSYWSVYMPFSFKISTSDVTLLEMIGTFEGILVDYN